MFDGLGKLILWALAIVGGVIVVKKYGPSVLNALSSAMPGNRALPAPNSSANDAASPNAAILVSCGPSSVSSGITPLQNGVQSSPTFQWCYTARSGDSAGLITERIVGDSARYQELLLANPVVAKKGTPGVVMGSDAWDFADGAIGAGTMIIVPLTMNAWIDPMGKARGTHLPWPPDPRSIVEHDETHAAFVPAEHAPMTTSSGSYNGEEDDVIESGHSTTNTPGFDFDYVESPS